MFGSQRRVRRAVLHRPHRGHRRADADGPGRRAIGWPRRGETWDDFGRRTDWEAHREAEKRKAAKKEAKAE